ncbi:MAG: DUF1697 domain-containing protein [Acidimicrobiia bacterium]|nr:DUF1697 domain-containing protein [Acidimicrobiia bacterium]
MRTWMGYARGPAPSPAPGSRPWRPWMPTTESRTTKRYLVMPRGINVGTGNRVQMAGLRSELAGAGFSDVATVLASGNVIVSTESDRPAEVAATVRRLLNDAFDVDVPCIARTADHVRGVLDRNPLEKVVSNPSRYLVIFLSEEPDPELVGVLLEEDHSPEAIAIEGTEAYVWSPDGVAAMTLSYAYLERRLDVVATARNWNTINKIVAKL